MKTLILILLLAIGFVGFSQSLEIDFHEEYDVTEWTVTKDTVWEYSKTGSHEFEFSWITTSLDASDAYVKLQVSPYQSGDYWFDYPSLDSVPLSATGYGELRSTTTKLIERRFRIKVFHGSVSSGTFLWRGNLITIKN